MKKIPVLYMYSIYDAQKLLNRFVTTFCEKMRISVKRN